MTEDEGIVFTRKDVETLTRLEGKLDSIEQKIDTLNTAVSNCQGNCKVNREAAAKRLTDLEDDKKARIAADKQTVKIAGIVSGVTTIVILLVNFILGLFGL